MSLEFPPRPLPTHDEYSEAIDVVQNRIDRSGISAKDYFLSQSLRLDSAKAFAAKAAQTANAIEPLDPETFQNADGDKRLGRAYFLGSLAAYRVVRELYSTGLPASTLLDHVPTLGVEIIEGDPVHNRIALYQAIEEMGSQGFELYGRNAQTRMQTWAETSVSNPSFRPAFAVAAGIVAIATTNLQVKRIESYDRLQLENMADSADEINWDFGLQLLLDGKE